MEHKYLPLKALKRNEGQIEGLPTNPREWSKAEIERLKKSIRQTPELMEARGIIVYPHKGEYIILGGNMRYTALSEMKVEQAPCIVLPEGMPIEKLKEIVIKDNGSFGSWDYDLLANEWDELPLTDWGVPAWGVEEAEKKATEKLSEFEFSSIYYEPEEKPSIRLADCIDKTKYNAKVAYVESLNLPRETKEVLKVFAGRFIKIDFESVANYYAFNATDAEKEAIERLRLVLVDGGIEGFIEDDMLRMVKELDTEEVGV